MKNNWHTFSLQRIYKELNSRAEGLTKEEAKKRLNKFGFNELPSGKTFSKLRVFLEQFKSPLVYILLIAGIITLILKESAEAIVIFGAVFLNTVVGYLQENKANQVLEKLKKILEIKALVFRDGNQEEVNQKYLVRGDVIFLRAGNRVPADSRIIESHNLKINESALTGEWLSSNKHNNILAKRTPLADRDNMVYMGTIVDNGWGKAIVIKTGIKAEIGQVAEMVKEKKENKTPYQKKLFRFSKIVGIVISIICLAIFFEGILSGKDFIKMFTTSVAVAVAAIPEGLPVAMTVILALGMQRILKKKGLVRRLASAETLGSASIILTDKTGTLTKAKMTVSDIFAGKKALLNNSQSENGSKKLALKIGMMATEAFIENFQEPPEKWTVRGRATEKALLVAGIKSGLSQQKLEKEQPKIDQFLFDPIYKFSASIHQFDSKNNILYIVGSPEKTLSSSVYLENNGQEEKILLKDLKKINEKINNLTKKGKRVVAVAYRKISKEEKSPINNLVNELTLVGLFALHDPIRKNAKKVMRICRQGGIRPIIVTGDHKLTAQEIAKELGFKTKPENILEGKKLDQISDKEFDKIIDKIHLYARVEPSQKSRIIQGWQKKGKIVAMTGDGINDAPALRQADIGVALNSGTDVAKEVSDIILLNDNFNVIVTAIQEGRAIIDNIRKVITYLLSDSFTEVVLIGVSLFLGLPLPVLATQILWVNLIEDGPLGISLAFQKKEKDVIKQRPENYNVYLLNREMKVLIFVIGLITDFLLLGLFFWLIKYSGYQIIHIRSVIFASLTIDSIFYIFSCQSLRKNIWHTNLFSNKFLIGSWLFGIIMLLGALYFPPLQSILSLRSLNLFDWSLILSLGILNVGLIELTKYYFISRHQA